MDTDKIDYSNPAANMYGCLPCPICGSGYRWPTDKRHSTWPDTIIYDDCGHRETLRE